MLMPRPHLAMAAPARVPSDVATCHSPNPERTAPHMATAITTPPRKNGSPLKKAAPALTSKITAKSPATISPATARRERGLYWMVSPAASGVYVVELCWIISLPIRGNPNIEIRNKSKIQNPKQIQLPLSEAAPRAVSDFGFVSDFDIRISD